MASKYELELAPPSIASCACCGGVDVLLTRYVYRHGDAFATYFGAYSNGHPGAGVTLLVSLGNWGAGDPARRTAFNCEVRWSEASSYAVTLEDAAQSRYREVANMGRLLSRDEALRHPLKAAAFDVVDAACLQDPAIQGFARRLECGNAALPLERNFQLPDDVFALGERRNARALMQENFVALDDNRFFVRCLLPIPIESYGTWCVGVWVEVLSEDFRRAWKVWEDPASYRRLRFSGIVANDVATDLELPVARGAAVELHVPDVDSVPRIASTVDFGLRELLAKPWPKLEFEQYAVARAFL